jgi:hypothetical protein
MLLANRTHNYKTVNSTGYGKHMIDAINFWVEMGWRVVAVVSDTRPGYAHSLILERPVGLSHPDD